MKLAEKLPDEGVRIYQQNQRIYQQDDGVPAVRKQAAVVLPDVEASGEDFVANGGPWPVADTMMALSPRAIAAKSKWPLAGNGKGGELSALSSKAIAVSLAGRDQGALAPESAQTLHHAQS